MNYYDIHFVFGEYKYSIPMKYFVVNQEDHCELLIHYYNNDNLVYKEHWSIGYSFLRLLNAVNFDFETDSLSFYSDELVIEKINSKDSLTKYTKQIKFLYIIIFFLLCFGLLIFVCLLFKLLP